jgi:hypothetical protein
MDYDVERCTRHCAESGREFADGEEFFSVLVREGSDLKRRDYSAAAWPGPPEGALGWWKSRMQKKETNKPRLAPSEVMLELFQQLADDPLKQDIRYVLTLLMVRRRILRLEETSTDEAGNEVMILFSPRDESTHHVVAAMPASSRIEEVQQELARLLFAGPA